MAGRPISTALSLCGLKPVPQRRDFEHSRVVSTPYKEPYAATEYSGRDEYARQIGVFGEKTQHCTRNNQREEKGSAYPHAKLAVSDLCLHGITVHLHVMAVTFFGHANDGFSAARHYIFVFPKMSRVCDRAREALLNDEGGDPLDKLFPSLLGEQWSKLPSDLFPYPS